MFVKSKMTSNPFTISPDQTLPQAHELIITHGIKRLPVVKNGKLVGIVSKNDIAHASPSKATTLSMGEITYLLAKTKVSQIMTKDPVTISPDALLEEAATLMRDHDLGCLPVMEDDKLVGIITESDILDSFIELMGFREPGTRLTFQAADVPGSLAHLTAIYGESSANITHIAVYRGSWGTSTVVVGTNSLNTEAIEQKAEAQGYKILYKLQNKS